MITKKELLELAEKNNAPCISIFIPTHRAGMETLKGKDALNLKNQLKEAKIKLEKRGTQKRSKRKLTKPIQDLINDSEFWRHQSDGLAVFCAENFFRKYTLPINFEEFNYVSNEFYLKSLIPLFNADGRFYLLTLKKNKVNFYEGTKYSISEIRIDDLTPSRLEDVVGYDYEQKSLQFRSQQQGVYGEGTFHGHAKNEEKAKNEILRYFRAIDKGLMSFLHDDQNPPLIVACLDYEFPIYREANSYKNLFPENISGNPAEMDINILHRKALELLEPQTGKDRQEKTDKFRELHNTEKTSTDIRDILPAAYLGKVDTLFLEKNSDIFGEYNEETADTEIFESQQPSNISLFNLAAIKIFEQNGKIFITEKEDMPDSTSPVNALYRY